MYLLRGKPRVKAQGSYLLSSQAKGSYPTNYLPI
jgi:hypothetical protein